MPFTDSDKTDIRRFCGYPAYGAAPAGFQNWRFYQSYGLLEFRMNNLSDAETAVVCRFLSTLRNLEAAVPRSSDNLDTEQAAIWTRNRNETRDRLRLFDEWCHRLCGFFGIPAGPALCESGVTLVV